jgi:hypothetical protein
MMRGREAVGEDAGGGEMVVARPKWFSEQGESGDVEYGEREEK